MDRNLERLDRPLTLDEVREGAPDIGWNLIIDEREHHVSEEDAKIHSGVEPGSYVILAFESEGERVGITIGFDPDTGEMRMMEFEHLKLDGVSLIVPNVDSTVPSAAMVEQILARSAEGAIGPPEYWEDLS